MCGRTACTLCPEDIQKACTFNDRSTGKFQQPEWKESSSDRYNVYKPSHNVAPTDVLPVLVSGCHFDSKQERVLQPMMWGMIPPWHKGDPKSHGLTTHNCRLENMASSKLYSQPFQKGYRCVIVCDGFYEWQTTKGKSNKQPYFIYMPQPDGVQIENPSTWLDDWSEDKGWKGPRLLSLAGLFYKYSSPEGELVYSCTILTMESTNTLSWLHHRTPAVLESDDHISSWLDCGAIPANKALTLLKAPVTLVWHAVSPFVNNARNKGEECNKPVSLSSEEKKKSASASFLQSWLKRGSAKTTDGDSSSQAKRSKI